jgi:hypothetical protein
MRGTLLIAGVFVAGCTSNTHTDRVTDSGTADNGGRGGGGADANWDASIGVVPEASSTDGTAAE